MDLFIELLGKVENQIQEAKAWMLNIPNPMRKSCRGPVPTSTEERLKDPPCPSSLLSSLSPLLISLTACSTPRAQLCKPPPRLPLSKPDIPITTKPATQEPVFSLCPLPNQFYMDVPMPYTSFNLSSHSYIGRQDSKGRNFPRCRKTVQKVMDW